MDQQLHQLVAKLVEYIIAGWLAAVGTYAIGYVIVFFARRVR